MKFKIEMNLCKQVGTCDEQLLSQIIATMTSTVKSETNNVSFTIEDILKGEFNWNMYEITPSCYVINICMLYRLYFKQNDFLKEELTEYTHANFHYATTFGRRNIAFQIWWLPCNPHRSEWLKTFLGGINIYIYMCVCVYIYCTRLFNLGKQSEAMIISISRVQVTVQYNVVRLKLPPTQKYRIDIMYGACCKYLGAGVCVCVCVCVGGGGGIPRQI